MDPQRWVDAHPFGFVLLLVCYFIVVWCLALIMVGLVGGWRTLAKTFCLQGDFSSTKWTWQSARMRWAMSYNHCLTVGADAAGLYLRMLPLFHVGHRPLFVPWHEIVVERRRKVFGTEFVTLRLGREALIPFTIQGKLVTQLQMAAGSAWPVEVT